MKIVREKLLELGIGMLNVVREFQLRKGVEFY
jgi:hypothetical protein